MYSFNFYLMPRDWGKMWGKVGWSCMIIHTSMIRSLVALRRICQMLQIFWEMLKERQQAKSPHLSVNLLQVKATWVIHKAKVQQKSRGQERLLWVGHQLMVRFNKRKLQSLNLLISQNLNQKSFNNQSHSAKKSMQILFQKICLKNLILILKRKKKKDVN